MSEPRFRSDIPVKYVQHCGCDGQIGAAAWVIDPDDRAGLAARTDEDVERVLRAMLRGRHGTPFEHGLLTVYVEAPVVVWWEWTRHRFMSLGCPDLGFNLESGRYRVLAGEFYVPPGGRPIYEPPGFRPMRPGLVDAATMVALDAEADGVELSEEDVADRAEFHGRYDREVLEMAAAGSWGWYRHLVDRRVGREVARLCLPFNVYYAGYVSASPRTWLQFFSLRRNDPRSAAATFPQWEIQKADEQCEAIFAQHWPTTYDLFNELGRVAPGA